MMMHSIKQIIMHLNSRILRNLRKDEDVLHTLMATDLQVTGLREKNQDTEQCL